MMQIVEVPDYIELSDAQLKQLITKAVETETNRKVTKVNIFTSSAGRGLGQVHCKIYLKKERHE